MNVQHIQTKHGAKIHLWPFLVVTNFNLIAFLHFCKCGEMKKKRSKLVLRGSNFRMWTTEGGEYFHNILYTCNQSFICMIVLSAE